MGFPKKEKGECCPIVLSPTALPPFMGLDEVRGYGSIWREFHQGIPTMVSDNWLCEHGSGYESTGSSQSPVLARLTTLMNDAKDFYP